MKLHAHVPAHNPKHLLILPLDAKATTDSALMAAGRTQLLHCFLQAASSACMVTALRETHTSISCEMPAYPRGGPNHLIPLPALHHGLAAFSSKVMCRHSTHPPSLPCFRLPGGPVAHTEQSAQTACTTIRIVKPTKHGSLACHMASVLPGRDQTALC